MNLLQSLLCAVTLFAGFACPSLADGPVVTRKSLGLGHIVDVSAVVAKCNDVNADCSAELLAAITVGMDTGGEVLLPPGDYYCNVTLNNVQKLLLRGSGRLATRLISRTANTPALTINGMWYSRIQDMGFATVAKLDDHGVLEINGGTIRGIQGNTFDNLMLNAQGTTDAEYSEYCMQMACDTVGVLPQGSEQLFLNCHFFGATEACYKQAGFNALNNTFIGGNMQAYTKHGIEVLAGNLHVISMGFQSTRGYTQILNDGWDINATYGGAYESILVEGCRSESLRFAKFNAGQRPSITACHQIAAIGEWTSGAAYVVGSETLLAVAATATVPAHTKLYICKTANSDVTFTPAKWDAIDFNCVDVQQGTISNCEWRVGTVICERALEKQTAVVTAATYAVRYIDSDILARAFDNAIALTLYNPTKMPEGTEVVITRVGETAHAVTINCPGFYFDNVAASQTITLNQTFRSVRLKVLGAAYEKQWYIVGDRDTSITEAAMAAKANLSGATFTGPITSTDVNFNSINVGTGSGPSKISYGNAGSVNSPDTSLALYENGETGNYFYGMRMITYLSQAGIGLFGGTGAKQPWNGTTGVPPHLFIAAETGNVIFAGSVLGDTANAILAQLKYGGVTKFSVNNQGAMTIVSHTVPTVAPADGD